MRELRVLLLSPMPESDPACGDVTYTENLLTAPPDGVTFEPYTDALAAGRLHEHARRASLASKPMAEFTRELLRTGREHVINRARATGALFREPFRFFSVSPGAYDLVHCHVYSVAWLGPRPPLLLSNGVPVTDLYLDARGWSPSRVNRAARRDEAIARLTNATHASLRPGMANYIVAFTDYLADWYRCRGAPEDRVTTIPPGLPRPSDRPTLRRRPQTVGFVAQDFHAKGGDTLLEAWQEITSSRSDLRLLIAGCPAQLGEEASRSLNIQWFGRLPRSQLLTTFYPLVDVLAYPSRFDGPSLVLQESLSYGIPIAVSDYGPLPSMVGDDGAGIVCPVDDVGAFARAIETLLDADRHRQASALAAARFDRLFHYPRTNGMLRRAYESVLELS